MTKPDGKKGMSKKRLGTAARIIGAMNASDGLLVTAAKKSGVSYTTVVRYAKDFPSVREAVTEAKEGMLDLAEGKLMQNIRNGDNTAIIFYLKTQGKSRGYTESPEKQNLFDFKVIVVYEDRKELPPPVVIEQEQ